MLPRRLLTIPVLLGPATFVGAVSASGNGGLWTTSNLTVSTGDILFIVSSARNGILGSDVTTGGTATLSSILSPTGGADSNYVTGAGGNDFLLDFQVRKVTSGGTVNLTENFGTDAAGFIMALRPSNGTLDFDTSDTGKTLDPNVILTSIPTYYAIILFETIQDDSSGSSSVIPSLRSGFTSAATEAWSVGTGGGAEGWGSRLSYDLSPNSSYDLGEPSNIGDATTPYWGAVGVVISNSF